MFCLKCNSENITPSHRRGCDWILLLVLLRPYRCHTCWHRFYRFLLATQVSQLNSLRFIRILKQHLRLNGPGPRFRLRPWRDYCQIFSNLRVFRWCANDQNRCRIGGDNSHSASAKCGHESEMWITQQERCVLDKEAGTKDMLVVVSCGSQKIWDRYPQAGPTRAEEAYTSSVFKVSRSYAETFGASWVILSTKYGFIPPDFVIPANYNQSFYDPSAISMAELRDQVKRLGLNRFAKVAVLGSYQYWTRVQQTFVGEHAELRHVNGNRGFPPVFIGFVNQLIRDRTPFGA